MVINEFVANPDGTDAGKEWIELYNPGTDSVDISGWYFRSYKSAGSDGDSASIPYGTVVVPGGFLLISGALVTGTDVTLETDFGTGSNGDGAYLVDACGEIVDAVVFGDSNADGAEDESGAVSATFAATPGKDESLARCGDGYDTNTSGLDFHLKTVDEVTPGATNGCVTPEYNLAEEVQLVINEVMPNPADTDTGFEWIEIYNAGTADAHLDAWTIAWYKSATSFGSASVQTGTIVPPGGVLLLGEEKVEGADVVMKFDFGNGDKGDAIYLLDFESTFEDGIIYGPPNTDGILNAPGGSVATSLAAKPGDGEALARCPDGVDTDASGADFQLLDVGAETPGALNGDCGDAVVEPGVCSTVGEVTVVINELMPALSGTDDDKEWVELYNTGSAVADLSGWILKSKKNSESDAESFALPVGTTLAPGAFLVAAESLAGVPTDVTVGLDLGQGTNGDGLYLQDCAESLADAVVYGGSNEDGILDESGAAATSIAPAPNDDESLGRIPDGADTNASGVDFCALSTPSAGSANSACK